MKHIVLALLLILSVGIATSSVFSNMARASDGSEYVTYVNMGERFAIEYPNNWTTMQDVPFSNGVNFTVVFFPPYEYHSDTMLGVFYEKSYMKSHQVSNQEILDYLIQKMKDKCFSYIINTDHVVCKDAQYQSEIHQHHNSTAYTVKSTWTWDNAFSNATRKMVTQWTLVPGIYQTWVVVSEGTSDDFEKYHNEFSNMTNSLAVDLIFRSPDETIRSNETGSSVHQEKTTWFTIWAGPSFPDNRPNFSPSSTIAYVGDTIAIGNADSETHHIVSGTPQSGPDGKFETWIAHGTVFRYVLKNDDVGTLHFYNPENPWMIGTITVKEISIVPEFGHLAGVMMLISVIGTVTIYKKFKVHH